VDFGPFGLSEILLIGGLAFIVFGPRRLPEVGHAAGRLVARLKRASAELRRAYEAELDEDTRRKIAETSRELREAGRALEVTGRELWQEGARPGAALRDAGARIQAPLAPASPAPAASPPVAGTPPPREEPPGA
jgi:Sec-independent protein translocase protein TatA